MIVHALLFPALSRVPASYPLFVVMLVIGAAIALLSGILTKATLTRHTRLSELVATVVSSHGCVRCRIRYLQRVRGSNNCQRRLCSRAFFGNASYARMAPTAQKTAHCNHLTRNEWCPLMAERGLFAFDADND